jgi:hypothetical protein
MTPITDLTALLAGAKPALQPERYIIETSESPSDMTAELFALIREEEGITLIRRDRNGPWALITMTIVSDLEAVGFTAAFARALTTRGIPANVVAAFHHDHIFVPWGRRHEALAALRNLSGDDENEGDHLP